MSDASNQTAKEADELSTLRVERIADDEHLIKHDRDDQPYRETASGSDVPSWMQLLQDVFEGKVKLSEPTDDEQEVIMRGVGYCQWDDGDETATLDGQFTPAQLRLIANKIERGIVVKSKKYAKGSTGEWSQET